MKIYLIIWFSIIHQLLFDGLRGQKEGDYLEEICFTIPQGNDIKEFYQKHPGLIKHKQVGQRVDNMKIIICLVNE